jgi:hypothetical protein
MEFNVGTYDENLLRKSRFGQNLTKLLVTLCEDLTAFYCTGDIK